MLVPFAVKARPRSSPPVLVSAATRALVALAAVCTIVVSVWLGDTISSTLPLDFARATEATPEPLRVTLPTVVIVGHPDSLDEVATAAQSSGSAAVSSMNPQDLNPGRVKFRQ